MLLVNGKKEKVPVTRNLSDHIIAQKRLKRDLLIKYYDLYAKMVKSKDMTVFKDQYTELVDQIEEIDNDIEKTQLVIQDLNASFYEELNELEAEYNETRDITILEKIQELKEDFVFKDYEIVTKLSAEKKAAIKKKIKKILALAT
jgi:hypothetical protein